MVHFDVPPGDVAQVRLIDTTSRLKFLPTKYLIRPAMPGFDDLPDMPSWAFLVESDTGKKALFDLGVPIDFREIAPIAASPPLMEAFWDIRVQSTTADIIRQHGVLPEEVSSIIWSHWHWDHIGNPSTFPGSTELVVGPGFKEAFLPGYPTKKDSPVRDIDFEGRTLREIDFTTENTITIGKFTALDFFGDGSFYLLDSPGHAIGHLCGLARTTTNPDTFVLMGGDLCHHGGEMRPSKDLPLPPDISPTLFPSGRLRGCPGSILASMQGKRGRGVDEPFFDPAVGPDLEEAIRSIRKAQEADADENVFFIFAHDDMIEGIVDLFPKTLNDWKSRGWAETTRWTFLRDFEKAMIAHEGQIAKQA